MDAPPVAFRVEAPIPSTCSIPPGQQETQRCPPGQWRPSRCPELEHEKYLWYAARRGLLGSLGYRVGGRAFVYRLRPALLWLHEHPVRGKIRGHARSRAFWRVIAEHRVSVLFCAPTAFRAIRKEDPEGEHIRRYDLSGFRMLFSAGERCDPDTLHWAEEQLKVPVIDHWWQTETGWAIGANCAGLELLPVKPGSCTKPFRVMISGCWMLREGRCLRARPVISW